MRTVFDVETSRFPDGHPFRPENRMYSYAYGSTIYNDVKFEYWTDPSFRISVSNVFETSILLVGFNIKFDIHWATICGVVHPIKASIWDCQLAEFVISGQTARMMSLDAALESYGLPLKQDKVKEYWDAGIDTKDIPVPILEEYNKHDVISTDSLYLAQQAIMSEKQKKLVLLMGEDLKALQHAEYHGIKFDFEKANDKLTRYSEELDAIANELRTYLPHISFGSFNFDSGDHLSALLYGGVIKFDYCTEKEAVYKSGAKKGETYVARSWFVEEVSFPRRFTPIEGTEYKKSAESKEPNPVRVYQTDAPTLSQLKTRKKEDKDLLRLLSQRSAKIKVVEMIRSIINKSNEMNWQGGFLHPQFNQTIAITGRLSSSAPNMQNTPEEIDELLVTRYVD